MTEPFPSLIIRRDSFEAQGSFAESQAHFLQPDGEVVAKLDALLREKKIGVVAHFYMDPELQGVLSSCTWPHIQISDSLVMADRGVAMVESGEVESVVVLGVDFMSENVRALLDANGHEEVPVYRVSEKEIGCSLAESAEARAYGAYLHEAAKHDDALHVVYINTSLEVKAKSHAVVPTITCTSSNVVRTVLQTFAQLPDARVFFGPDTYMGDNLDNLFKVLSELDDEAIAEVHPAHNQASVKAMLSRFEFFKEGSCVVHHMFGAEVTEIARESYGDAYVAAHLEVPGEMFALGLERQQKDEGVVGSTSNILGFIARKTEEAAKAEGPARVRAILGTEAGMITAVVRKVQSILREHDRDDVDCEIIFPVASQAIATTDDPSLPVVPGVSSGEGCTTAGGCATCPYMKMNSLDALMALGKQVGVESQDKLVAFYPKKYVTKIAGRSAADLGGEPILHMRHFQTEGELSNELIEDIKTRRERPMTEAG